MTLEKIDFQKRRFKGVEKEYLIGGSISVGRYQFFEKFQLEMAYGGDVVAMHKTLNDVFELLNKGKQADAAVRIHNQNEQIGRIGWRREHPVLRICTLFCYSPGEDLSVWSEEQAIAKIEDWKNIDIADFFTLAANSVPGFVSLWVEASQSISQPQKATV